MDKVSKFNNPDFYTQLLRYNDLSYRRYERLTDKHRRALEDFGELLPDETNMTLKIFHLLRTTRNTESIPMSINVMSIIYKEYYEWLAFQKDQGKLGKPLSEETAYNELIFRGFVPLGKFKVKPQRSYVMTCRPILEKHLIHPYEMGSNYRMVSSKGKDLPYLWENFQKIGLPGYCRVIYPEMEHYPNLSPKQITQLKLNWGV